MKYFTAGVVFSEIPDEITLELGISNCPFRCEGCHSPFLQADVGRELTQEHLDELIRNNKGITCVLFSGGDASIKDVQVLSATVKANHPGLKTAWYSGRETIPKGMMIDYLDYIKLGPYKQDLGGLKSRTTNQRLYQYLPSWNGTIEGFGRGWRDITEKFWK